MVVFEEVGDAGGHGQVADLFAAEISNGCLQVGDTRAERKCGGVDAAEDAGGEGRVAFHDRFQVGAEFSLLATSTTFMATCGSVDTSLIRLRKSSSEGGSIVGRDQRCGHATIGRF